MTKVFLPPGEYKMNRDLEILANTSKQYPPKNITVLPVHKFAPSKPYEYRSSPTPFPPHFSPPPG